MSLFKLEVEVQTDIGTAFLTFLELFKALFLLEPLLLFGVLKQLDTKRREIENVLFFCRVCRLSRFYIILKAWA